MNTKINITKMCKGFDYLLKENIYKIILDYDLHGNKIQQKILNGKFIRMCLVNVNASQNSLQREVIYCPLFEYEETVNYLYSTRKITHQRLIHPFNRTIRMGYDDE
jgi:hypothetical protein